MSSFQQHRRAGIDEPRRRRAGHRGSADRDRRGTLRRDPGGLLLQLLHEPREALRVRDGRLLARVPEYLGEELHVIRAFDGPHGHESADCDDRTRLQCQRCSGRQTPVGRLARGEARVSTSLAEINVVPLVDVMLVLLIIFMVTAPMMQQGLQVNLPQARRATPVTAQPIYVTVPADFGRRAHRAARQGRRADRFSAASACGRRCLARDGQVGLHPRRRRRRRCRTLPR